MSDIKPYLTALSQTLEPVLPGYLDFFSNPRRLSILNGLLLKYCQNESTVNVLNVGCGPFAAEMLLPILADKKITSFDYMCEYATIYERLRADGYLSNTQFIHGDARNACFDNESFDLIIMNDIFYEKDLSLKDILARYTAFLKPGGLIIFDIINARTRWIWKLLGKADLHKRYDHAEITELWSELGLTCLEHQPLMGYKDGFDKLFRLVLWYGFGLSNNYIYLVKKGV